MPRIDQSAAYDVNVVTARPRVVHHVKTYYYKRIRDNCYACAVYLMKTTAMYDPNPVFLMSVHLLRVPVEDGFPNEGNAEFVLSMGFKIRSSYDCWVGICRAMDKHIKVLQEDAIAGDGVLIAERLQKWLIRYAVPLTKKQPPHPRASDVSVVFWESRRVKR